MVIYGFEYPQSKRKRSPLYYVEGVSNGQSWGVFVFNDKHEWDTPMYDTPDEPEAVLAEDDDAIKRGYTDRTQQTAICPTGRDGLKQEVPDFSNKTPARRKWS
mgnify:FL=1